MAELKQRIEQIAIRYVAGEILDPEDILIIDTEENHKLFNEAVNKFMIGK